ncbi:MAG: hypothetical protein ABFS14_05050 [Gemmatimonadota bacterium]
MTGTLTNTETAGRPPARVLLRDLAIFQLKLVLDGFKDLFLTHVALGAALLDLLARRKPATRFYSVVRASERFDLWLNLHGASRDAAQNEDGLFGTSEAGADTLLGKIEEIVVGLTPAPNAAPRHEAA